MADKQSRHSDNAPGAWYVDSNCIICGLCSEYAPNVFRPSEDGDHNYVFHQPENEAEREEANRAREACPTDAIGDDNVPD